MLNPEIVAHLQEIDIGPVTVHGYGIVIGIAIAAAITFLWSYLPSQIKRNPQLPLYIASTITGGIFGGRLMYVLFSLQTCCTSLLDTLYIWKGGISIFGVITGGFLGYTLGWLILEKKKTLPFWTLPDFFVPAVALGQSIGRWGNFINQEITGFPTDLPWAMYISPENRTAGYTQFDYFHPVFVYESILTFICAVVLCSLIRKNHEKYTGKGFLTGLYLMMYGSIRWVMERFRIDQNPVFSFIKIPDIAAIILLFCGFTLIIHARHDTAQT